MKLRLFKAGIVSLTVMATITGSTFAYFTSTVQASGNKIQAGSLTVAVDTTKNHSAPSTPIFGTDAYEVAIDSNGTTVLNSDPTKRFESWTGAMPGDDGFDVWVGIRNPGNGPFVFKFRPEGSWTDIRETEECQADVVNPRTDLISFENIVQYSSGSDCDASNECATIRDALLPIPFTYSPSATPITYPASVKMVYGIDSFNYFFGSDDGLSGGARLALSPTQFVVYKMRMKMNPDASDCYQNATYNWALQVKGYQGVSDIDWTL
jgi:predicted ribosomally synthesized peptide with SipW-like signal peptide